jgi:UDP-N-acetyl-D-mannosaminuronic acid dehydrogenase
MEFDKICVIGLGYIGLPTASMFANHGKTVIGVDVNQEIVTTLNNGGMHIHEPGLKEVLTQAFLSKRLSVMIHPEAADAFIIAVPTPFYENKKADMRFVRAAAESILPYLKRGNLVVLESTSPPRTTLELIKPIMERSDLKAGDDFLLAYSPERVLPGQILRELIENARVIGGITPASAEAGRDLYRAFVQGEIILTDSTTAEMVKLMENTYRDVNIAIANEFSRLSDRFGVNIWEAIRIANLHPRVKVLNPGPGVGGHCISVDPWFLVEAAPDLSPLIRTARLVNDNQPKFVVDLAERVLGSLKGKKIAALGLAYKPDVDDLRESPAIEIVHLLEKAEAKVNAFEPFRPGGYPGINMSPSLELTLQDSDLILILVGHTQFKHMQPEQVLKMTVARTIMDTVNILGAEWINAGFTVYQLGNGQQWVKSNAFAL